MSFPQIKKYVFLYQDRMILYNFDEDNKQALIPFFHLFLEAILPHANRIELQPNDEIQWSINYKCRNLV